MSGSIDQRITPLGERKGHLQDLLSREGGHELTAAVDGPEIRARHGEGALYSPTCLNQV